MLENWFSNCLTIFFDIIVILKKDIIALFSQNSCEINPIFFKNSVLRRNEELAHRNSILNGNILYDINKIFTRKCF